MSSPRGLVTPETRRDKEGPSFNLQTLGFQALDLHMGEAVNSVVSSHPAYGVDMPCLGLSAHSVKALVGGFVTL